MKPKKIYHYSNKTQPEIFNISQLSAQQLNHALSNNPSLINTIDNNGETLLSYALKKNNYKIYDLLLNSPFLYLNFQNKDGDSYLHLAVKNQLEKIIKNLVEKGIKINIQNKKGNTALHIAYETGNNSIIKYLIEHGINRTIKNKENKKAEEIKKNIKMNKNQSVTNFSSLNIAFSKNKIIGEFKNSDAGFLKASQKEDNIFDNNNINNNSVQENGGKFQEEIKYNIIQKKNKNHQFIIRKNNQEKDLSSTEFYNNNNSNIIASKGEENYKKTFKIKLDFDKLNKGGLHKEFSLKENNVKDNKEEEDELFEYNNKSNNQINYTERGSKNFNNINKRLNFEESTSSFLESSDYKNKKSKKQNISSNNKITSFKDIEYTSNITGSKICNKKRQNNKRNSFRNNIYNIGDINDIEKWNTIQIGNSQKKVKVKNKPEINMKNKLAITKRNSPKKNIAKTKNISSSKNIKNKKSKNEDNFIIGKSYNNNRIDRYFNEDNNNQKFLDDEKVRRIEHKDYDLEKEDIDDNNDVIFIEDMPNKISYKNSFISTNKMNKSEDNILTLKSGRLLKDFLFQINMDKYLNILATNGFDDINLILEQSKNGGTSILDSELKEAGISIPGDRAKILIRIQELSNNFAFPIPKEVYHQIEDINKIENDEHIQKLKRWLENLKVEDYLINFIYSGYHSVELLLLQMISNNPLTSEMLKEEIGIDKIGYRSRIINKLKDEAKYFLSQLKTKTLVINKGDENSNNCQCIMF